MAWLNHRRRTVRSRGRRYRSVRFDWGGFILVAAFLGALEFVLDRGQQDDWFGSNFIITCTCISALAVLLWIPWEASRRNPVVDLKMMASRQFGSCFLVMRWSPSGITRPSTARRSKV